MTVFHFIVLPLHHSHIMARSKPDGGTRLIVNLSWPHNNSINSCVPANIFFVFMAFKLKYPTIEQVVGKIKYYGVMCCWCQQMYVLFPARNV